LEYEKDVEYGYSHIATLSGGLDCRTSLAYANKLNFNGITCFTFSQSEYLDEKIAKKICSDNHMDFLFYSLDNGTYLTKNIDNIISSNDGLIFYLGSAHLYNCLKKLSLNDYGLIHTGLIGDLVLGSYLKEKTHHTLGDDILNKTAYSNKLFDKLSPLISIDSFNYENDELFAFYERCVNGVFNGYRMIEQFTEFASPFLYLDFLEYAMRIHPKYRYKESIYLKWISIYTPEFVKYKWERYGLSPQYPLALLNLYNIFRHLPYLINRRTQKHFSMNPTEYWWKTNKNLQDTMYQNFNENFDTLKSYPDLYEDSSYLFNKGSLIEKTQVLTVMKAMRSLNIYSNPR
jgi:asparagine synthase (glutamine-hydrolysing)